MLKNSGLAQAFHMSIALAALFPDNAALKSNAFRSVNTSLLPYAIWTPRERFFTNDFSFATLPWRQTYGSALLRTCLKRSRVRETSNQHANQSLAAF
jgi:hypothetical protein